MENVGCITPEKAIAHAENAVTTNKTVAIISVLRLVLLYIGSSSAVKVKFFLRRLYTNAIWRCENPFDPNRVLWHADRKMPEKIRTQINITIL